MANDCPETTIEKAVKASEGGGWLSTNVRPVITLAVLAWVFVMSFVLLFYTTPDNERVANALLLLVTNIFTAMISYHFGSSEGSRLKTILDKLPKE